MSQRQLLQIKNGYMDLLKSQDKFGTVTTENKFSKKFWWLWEPS